jgi:hypothetical protein
MFHRVGEVESDAPYVVSGKAGVQQSIGACTLFCGVVRDLRNTYTLKGSFRQRRSFVVVTLPSQK